MKKKTDKPVSKNGFKLFTIGFVFAIIVGHFFKFYFNNNRLTVLLENKLIEQNLDFEFDIKGINFILADGIWPAFGFYVEDLIITSKDTCKLPLQIVLKDSFVKLKTFKSIFKKKLYLSSTHIGSARILESKSLCEKYKQEHENSELQSLITESDRVIAKVLDSDKIALKREKNLKASFVKLASDINNQLSIFFDRNEKYLEDWPSVQVDEIFYIKDGQNFVLQQFEINPDEKSLLINTNLNFSFSKIELQGLPIVNFKISLAKPVANIEVSTRYREGRVHNDLEFDWLTYNYTLKTNIYDLPVHSLLKWLKQQGIYNESWHPELVWLSCQINSTGQLNKPSVILLEFEPCAADAEKGRFEFKNLRVDPFYISKIKPFMINIFDVPISSFLKSINKAGPYRIFSEFGVLSGEVSIKSKDEIEANWSIKNLESLFSKNGVNAFQKIPQVDLKMSYVNNRISGLIHNVELTDGNFKGQFSYNFNELFKNGMIQFNVEELELNPAVQKLLVGRSLSTLSLYGQAQFKDSEIIKWRGSFGVKNIESQNALYKNLKLDFEYKKPFTTAKVSLASIEATPKHLYFDLMSSLSLDFDPNTNSPLLINNLNAKISTDSGLGEWSQLSAKLIANNKNFSIASSGSWVEKSFSGSIYVLDNLKQSWNWLLLGSLSELYLAPSSQLIDQVQNNKLKTYKIPKDKFKKGMTKTEFKGIDFKKSSPIELLKSMGVNFIESAKKIMPNSETKK